MSHPRLIAIFSTLLTLITAPAFGSDLKRVMTDPLFGLRYSPENVSFELASKSLARQCPQLRDRKLWIYAAWQSNEAEYLVVSGFVRVLPDMPETRGGSVEPDPAGVMVELRGGICRISTPELFLSGKISRSKKQLSAEPNQLAINGLVADVMKRYAEAFGGKDAFINKIRLQKVDLPALPPALRELLESASKQNEARLKK